MTPEDHDMRSAVCDLARRMDASPHGDRGRLVGEFAGHYGMTVQSAYRRLQKVGWQSGRKRRADAGTSSVPEAVLLDMTGAMRGGVRKNGKPTLHTPTARSIMHANGRPVP